MHGTISQTQFFSYFSFSGPQEMLHAIYKTDLKVEAIKQAQVKTEGEGSKLSRAYQLQRRGGARGRASLCGTTYLLPLPLPRTLRIPAVSTLHYSADPCTIPSAAPSSPVQIPTPKISHLNSNFCTPMKNNN